MLYDSIKLKNLADYLYFKQLKVITKYKMNYYNSSQYFTEFNFKLDCRSNVNRDKSNEFNF